MARSNVEVDVNAEGEIIGDLPHHAVSSNGNRDYKRARSIIIQKLPLQEAMKNHNSKNSFATAAVRKIPQLSSFHIFRQKLL